MKKTVLIILSVLVLLTSGCGQESFNILDTKEFNDKIADRTDIGTPEELIEIYYDRSEVDDNSTVTINTIDLGDNIYEITLIHEGLPDDSVAGRKIVMTAELTGTTWIVTEIKENWKCWEGRGSAKWGTKLCY